MNDNSSTLNFRIRNFLLLWIRKIQAEEWEWMAAKILQISVSNDILRQAE